MRKEKYVLNGFKNLKQINMDFHSSVLQLRNRIKYTIHACSVKQYFLYLMYCILCTVHLCITFIECNICIHPMAMSQIMIYQFVGFLKRYHLSLSLFLQCVHLCQIQFMDVQHFSTYICQELNKCTVLSMFGILFIWI